MPQKVEALCKLGPAGAGVGGRMGPLEQGCKSRLENLQELPGHGGKESHGFPVRTCHSLLKPDI